MSKLGGIRKNWKKRWFVAYKDALVCSRIPPLFFFFLHILFILRHPMFSLISIIVRAATCMCKERSNDVSNAFGVGVCLDHLFRSLRDCCNLEVYLLLHYPILPVTAAGFYRWQVYYDKEGRDSEKGRLSFKEILNVGIPSTFPSCTLPV